MRLNLQPFQGNSNAIPWRQITQPPCGIARQHQLPRRPGWEVSVQQPPETKVHLHSDECFQLGEVALLGHAGFRLSKHKLCAQARGCCRWGGHVNTPPSAAEWFTSTSAAWGITPYSISAYCMVTASVLQARYNLAKPESKFGSLQILLQEKQRGSKVRSRKKMEGLPWKGKLINSKVWLDDNSN